MKIKRSLVIGATLATLGTGIGSVGLVSAATDTSGTSSTSSTSGTSLVDKLVAKFKLNKADVQAVFDADHKEHEAQMEADMKTKLATAVTDGKLTQAQADHITQVMSEIKTLRGDTAPPDESTTVRDQIKAKLDELHTWATDNNVDTQYIMFGHGGPRTGGPAGMGDNGPSTSAATGSSTSTLN